MKQKKKERKNRRLSDPIWYVLESRFLINVWHEMYHLKAHLEKFGINTILTRDQTLSVKRSY